MKKTILLALAGVLLLFTGQAQEPEHLSDGALLDGKTMVKADVLGLALRNFGFSAERVINKNLSANLSMRFMPTGGLPMLGAVKKYVNPNEDPKIDSYLENMKIRSFALTPELRIYIDKYGYGKGFYLAPYYTFFSFNLEDFKIEEQVEGKMEHAILNGDIQTHSGGLMLGYQWMLGEKKNIIIDWGIIGAHYGGSSGKLNGDLSRALEEKEQADLKNILDENLSDIPLFKFTSEVGPNSTKITEKGAWAFPRAYLSIGFRF